MAQFNAKIRAVNKSYGQHIKIITVVTHFSKFTLIQYEAVYETVVLTV